MISNLINQQIQTYYFHIPKIIHQINPIIKYIVIKYQSQQHYQLQQFKNQHRHTKKFVKSIKIEQYIKTLPKDMTFREYKKKMKKKFNLKKSSLVYWLKKAYLQPLQFKDLVVQMDFRYYQYSYSPFDEKILKYPQYLLVMTPKMKQNYLRYGSVIGFSIFKKISTPLGLLKKKYELSIIMGLNCASQTIPFAIILVAQSDLSSYQMVFAKFFDSCSIKPKVIITPSTPYICSILRYIKKRNIGDFQHLYEKFKVLKSVKKNLTEESRIQDFNQLLEVMNISKFQQCVQNLIPKLNQNDRQLFFKFLQKSEKYCFCFMPNQFIGLNNSPSMSQQMQNRIIQQLQQRKTYVQYILSICKFLDKHPLVVWEIQLVGDRKQKKIQQNPSLKYLCEKLQKKAFEKFAEQYYKTNKIIILRRQENIFQLELEKQIFYVIKANNRWKCNCDIQIKTGLPCCHLLIAIFMRFEELEPYIHLRWFIQNDNYCHLKGSSTRKKSMKRSSYL